MLEQKHNAPTQVPPPGWFGPFYCSREDRRVILPKRWGYGYTFNFARPATYALIFVLLAAPLVVLAAVLILAR
jgi:uncharacterized membrane protein